MPFRFSYKSAFLKKFQSLSSKDQALVTGTLESVKRYFKINEATFGLRIKKLYERDYRQVFEARVSSNIRVVWILKKEDVVFTLIGNHEDVRRFIKNL